MRRLFYVIGVFAVLFIGNAVIGSDRLWNYVDYAAISEQTAMDSARDVTVCMPTVMTVKGTPRLVKLKKGDKVKLLARYQEYLVPLVRSGDYLPTFDFLVMLSDSTICKGKLPEALIGATAVVRGKEMKVTGVKAAKSVGYELGGRWKQSKYGFWVLLADGSRLAFEQLTWKRIGYISYNARGRWTPSPKKYIVPQEMAEKRYTLDDTIEKKMGSRPMGYYKPRNGFTDSSHFKAWSARGVAGVVEGVILFIILTWLPLAVHKVVYRLPGKNWWIIFLSWVALIGVSVMLYVYFVTSIFNCLFYIITLLSVLNVKADVEGSRCKYCGGVDCLRQVAGSPKKTYTWWGGWRKGEEKVGEVVETTVRGGVTESTTRQGIYKNVETRTLHKTSTWGEAYVCEKCHARYEYMRRSDTLSSAQTRNLESDDDAINREKSKHDMI